MTYAAVGKVMGNVMIISAVLTPRYLFRCNKDKSTQV